MGLTFLQNFKLNASSEPNRVPNPFLNEFFEGKLITIENNNIIASYGGTKDLDIFEVKNNKITKVFTIKDRFDYSYSYGDKLIPFTKNRFSALTKTSLLIWSGEAPYKEEPIIEMAFPSSPYSQIHLKGTETIAVTTNDYLYFYELNQPTMKSIHLDNKGGDALVQVDDETLVVGMNTVNLKTHTISSFYNQQYCEFFTGIKLRDNKVYFMIWSKEDNAGRCEVETSYTHCLFDPKSRTVKFGRDCEKAFLYKLGTCYILQPNFKNLEIYKY